MNIPLAQFKQNPLDFRKTAKDMKLSIYEDGTPADNFGNLIARLMNVVMVFALLMVLLYLVWGAIEWITAGGEKGKIDAARNKMTNALIGIIILSGTLAIFKFVQYLLGVEIITFV